MKLITAVCICVFSLKLNASAQKPVRAASGSGTQGKLPVFLDDSTVADSRPLLALAGRVPVKVTAEAGAIRIGDLLISSSKAGYAMRQPRHLLRKNLRQSTTTLGLGAGTIQALLTLQ